MSEAAIRTPQKGTIEVDRTFKFVFDSNMTGTIRIAVAEDVVRRTLVASRSRRRIKHDRRRYGSLSVSSRVWK